jgi:hypothetical protein
VQKQFSNIWGLIGSKDKCVFCQGVLSARLTNFLGIKKNGSPIINVQIKSKITPFHFAHTTASYDIQMECSLNADNNEVSFVPVSTSSTPTIDQLVAEQAFEELCPHIELYCSNKNCSYGYYLSSSIFTLDYACGVGPKRLMPIKLYMEAFQTPSLFIQNDLIREELNIYVLDNESAKPIKSSMIDFETTSPDQALARVSMLVNFN